MRDAPAATSPAVVDGKGEIGEDLNGRDKIVTTVKLTAPDGDYQNIHLYNATIRSPTFEPAFEPVQYNSQSNYG